MLTALYLMSSSSSKYSVISWFWPPKYFLIESAELDFSTTRKYNLSSFPNCCFCSDLSSVRRLGESPITQDEGHFDSSQLSLLPPPQGRFLSRLFYPFNSGLHHLLPRPLVIILSSCYFEIYNSFSIWYSRTSPSAPPFYANCTPHCRFKIPCTFRIKCLYPCCSYTALFSAFQNRFHYLKLSSNGDQFPFQCP